MVGDLVKRNIGNLVLLVINVVSQERRSLVNPKREKNKDEDLRGISGNIQSQGTSKLVPKGSSSEVPTGEFCANEV